MHTSKMEKQLIHNSAGKNEISGSHSSKLESKNDISNQTICLILSARKATTINAPLRPLQILNCCSCPLVHRAFSLKRLFA